jgi:hypothetical protein
MSMAISTLSGPQGTLAVEREMISVSYLSDIDADWKFTDANGHQHYCVYEGADHYPTLRRVVDETYWCGECGDEHELAHLECRQCGEAITPGTTGPGEKVITGVVTYTFNGELITPERARQIVAEWAD